MNHFIAVFITLNFGGITKLHIMALREPDVVYFCENLHIMKH